MQYTLCTPIDAELIFWLYKYYVRNWMTRSIKKKMIFVLLFSLLEHLFTCIFLIWSYLLCFLSLISAMNDVGNKELELIPIDPLILDKLSIIQSADSPVNIKLNFRNLSLTGIKDVVVTKVVYVLHYWIICFFRHLS